MIYKQEGETVTLTMSESDYGMLCFILGYAMASARRSGQENHVGSFLAFTNALNETNPNYSQMGEFTPPNSRLVDASKWPKEFPKEELPQYSRDLSEINLDVQDFYTLKGERYVLNPGHLDNTDAPQVR